MSAFWGMKILMTRSNTKLMV